MTTQTEQNKPKRKKTATYHDAAFAAFNYRLRKYIKDGVVELEDEHQLSKRPLRIDIMVIKKNANIEIETAWGKIFRGHNVIEYKSPVDKSVSMLTFNKLNGYAWIYASQENIKISDISATIVCFDKPTALFKELQSELDYRILRANRGIYYIKDRRKTENLLSIQVIVCSELDDSDLVLKALRSKIDSATARKVIELPIEDEELSQWWEVMTLENGEILSKEANMGKIDAFLNGCKARGLMTNYDNELRQEGMQQGMRQGMQQGIQKMQDIMDKVFALIEQGVPLAEAKKRFGLS